MHPVTVNRFNVTIEIWNVSVLLQPMVHVYLYDEGKAKNLVEKDILVSNKPIATVSRSVRSGESTSEEARVVPLLQRNLRCPWDAERCV